jgi:hypothetical protein
MIPRAPSPSGRRLFITRPRHPAFGVMGGARRTGGSRLGRRAVARSARPLPASCVAPHGPADPSRTTFPLTAPLSQSPPATVTASPRSLVLARDCASGWRRPRLCRPPMQCVCGVVTLASRATRGSCSQAIFAEGCLRRRSRYRARPWCRSGVGRGARTQPAGVRHCLTDCRSRLLRVAAHAFRLSSKPRRTGTMAASTGVYRAAWWAATRGVDGGHAEVAVGGL